MTQEKKVWLKNTLNGNIYQVWESEVSIYQTDKDLVVLATPEEVKKFEEGTYWATWGKPVATDVAFVAKPTK